VGWYIGTNKLGGTAAQSSQRRGVYPEANGHKFLLNVVPVYQTTWLHIPEGHSLEGFQQKT
jgi:hypothetical protein